MQKSLKGGKIEWKLKKSTYSTTWKMKFSLLYLRRYVFLINLREVWMNILPSQQQLTSNQPPLTRNPKAKGKVNLSFSLNASNFVIHKHFVGWQRERDECFQYHQHTDPFWTKKCTSTEIWKKALQNWSKIPKNSI